jgi:hypothetical protein
LPASPVSRDGAYNDQSVVPTLKIRNSGKVPHLGFYAIDGDQDAVLAAVFDLGLFRVFEAYSQPDRALREFSDAQQVPRAAHRRNLMLYVPESGPEPMFPQDAARRYMCEGWGLIQLYFGDFFRGTELHLSRTNHNSQKRAAKWSTLPDSDDPAEWDWPLVTRASGKLNRAIRKLAVDKIGAHPVLPEAAVLISRAGLRFERGAGIHATPMPI